jgi:hypothetical protein
MTTSFSRRRINVRFTLGRGDFGAAGADAVEANGYRVSASIVKTGGESMSNLSLKIWGLSLDVMNKLTILGTGIAQNGRENNTVTVSAGDDDSGLAVVFRGIMSECWVDTRDAPRVALVVSAFTGLIDNLKPVPPLSYKGTVDAATVMAGIAAQMSPPIPLVNSGVDVQFVNPYWPGTLRAQALAAAREGQFNLFMDDTELAIWPNGGARDGLIPFVSPDTGMVGYPMHTQAGIQIMTLFNPSIVFGRRVRISSELVPAIGDTWTPSSIAHDLESELPGGKWFTTFECNLLGQESYHGG